MTSYSLVKSANLNSVVVLFRVFFFSRLHQHFEELVNDAVVLDEGKKAEEGAAREWGRGRGKGWLFGS